MLLLAAVSPNVLDEWPRSLSCGLQERIFLCYRCC